MRGSFRGHFGGMVKALAGVVQGRAPSEGRTLHYHVSDQLYYFPSASIDKTNLIE